MKQDIKERPILFNGEMVRAILDGRKTQTRRLVKPQPTAVHEWRGWIIESSNRKSEGCASWGVGDHPLTRNAVYARCPQGKVGDRLWVRETFQPIWAEGFTWESEEWPDYKTGEGYNVSYPATDGIIEFLNADGESSFACRPSIHMPRWASRIILEITGVRVERLQDISADDARAEGVRNDPQVENCEIEGKLYSSRYLFEWLWQSVYGADSWESNPWVWVIEFKRIDQ